MSVLRNKLPYAGCIKSFVKTQGQIRNSSVAITGPLKKLKEMQASMQCNDGVPIYLKRGTRDRLLYQFNLILTAFACIDSLRFIWRWAKK